MTTHSRDRPCYRFQRVIDQHLDPPRISRESLGSRERCQYFSGRQIGDRPGAATWVLSLAIRGPAVLLSRMDCEVLSQG